MHINSIFFFFSFSISSAFGHAKISSIPDNFKFSHQSYQPSYSTKIPNNCTVNISLGENVFYCQYFDSDVKQEIIFGDGPTYNFTDDHETPLSNFNVNNITILENVTSIGDYLFASTSLKAITIPSTVTYIGNKAFKNCSLENVIIDPNNTYFSLQDNVLFSRITETFEPTESADSSVSNKTGIIVGLSIGAVVLIIVIIVVVLILYRRRSHDAIRDKLLSQSLSIYEDLNS